MIDHQQYRRVLALNNDAVPHVNELSVADLAGLVERAEFSCCLEQGRSIEGFLIGLRHDNDYDGYNFRWFQSRYDDFLYIDRIVVNPQYSGRGIGRRLYESAIAWCNEQGVANLVCEVNDDPPNPGSHGFHRKIGFNNIESIEHPSGKTVCMYAKCLSA